MTLHYRTVRDCNMTRPFSKEAEAVRKCLTDAWKYYLQSELNVLPLGLKALQDSLTTNQLRSERRRCCYPLQCDQHSSTTL